MTLPESTLAGLIRHEAHHLTADKPNDNHLLRAQGLSLSGVGEIPSRSNGTTSRELARNKGVKGYRLHHLYKKAQACRGLRRGGKTVSMEVWTACRRLIENDYSPQ